MRTLILTAAALLFCASGVNAQTGTTTPVQTKPMTTAAQTPTSSLAEQKKNMTAELKKTLSSADNLLISVNKVGEGATGENHDVIMRVATGVKMVQKDLTTQLGLVDKATDKTAQGVFNKAKEVNAASVRKLESLKSEMPSTKPALTPPDTKPSTPVETK